MSSSSPGSPRRLCALLHGVVSRGPPQFLRRPLHHHLLHLPLLFLLLDITQWRTTAREIERDLSGGDLFVDLPALLGFGFGTSEDGIPTVTAPAVAAPAAEEPRREAAADRSGGAGLVKGGIITGPSWPEIIAGPSWPDSGNNNAPTGEEVISSGDQWGKGSVAAEDDEQQKTAVAKEPQWAGLSRPKQKWSFRKQLLPHSAGAGVAASDAGGEAVAAGLFSERGSEPPSATSERSLVNSFISSAIRLRKDFSLTGAARGGGMGITDFAWSRCGRSFFVAQVLTIFLFGLGAGRFYLGYMKTGCVQLLLSIMVCLVAGKPTPVYSTWDGRGAAAFAGVFSPLEECDDASSKTSSPDDVKKSAPLSASDRRADVSAPPLSSSFLDSKKTEKMGPSGALVQISGKPDFLSPSSWGVLPFGGPLRREGFFVEGPGGLGWLAPALRFVYVSWMVVDVALLWLGMLEPSC